MLDATPERGKDFSRAVRDVLDRESTWVEWKKGGKGFSECCCCCSYVLAVCAGQQHPLLDCSKLCWGNRRVRPCVHKSLATPLLSLLLMLPRRLRCLPTYSRAWQHGPD